MIAVGQFERLDHREGHGDQAEVAFLVQDNHQHRGIGQLLLEHLAQVGREVGVEKFVAEVLPENLGMLQVFREAGYVVAGGFEDGVMHMEFSIDATATSLEVMQGREHRAETASVHRFFDARSVADRRGQPPPGHRRAPAGAQPGPGRLPGPGVRREPGRGRRRGHAGVRRGVRHPRRRGHRDRRRPGRVGPRGRPGLREEGRARHRRGLRRLRRDRGRGAGPCSVGWSGCAAATACG